MQKLDLRWNQIMDDEAAYLLEVLKSNPRGIQVCLGGNHLKGNKIGYDILFGINKVVLDAQKHEAQEREISKSEVASDTVQETTKSESIIETISLKDLQRNIKSQRLHRPSSISHRLEDQYATFDPTTRETDEAKVER